MILLDVVLWLRGVSLRSLMRSSQMRRVLGSWYGSVRGFRKASHQRGINSSCPYLPSMHLLSQEVLENAGICLLTIPFACALLVSR